MDDLEADFFAERMRRNRQQFERWLVEAAQRLSSRHGIADVAAHRELLQVLRGVMHEHSSWPTFELTKWSIPKDLMSWKTARAKLTRFALGVGVARRSLVEIIEDPVLMGAFNHIDTENRLPNLVEGLYELEQLAQEAAAIEGRKGNRPNPPWTREAARLCREFWRRHKGAEPTRYFNPAKKPRRGERIKARTTEPANPFSCWFCDVMDKVGGLKPSECDTILRRQ